MLKETTGQTIKYLREKNDLTRENLCQMIRLGGNSRTEDVQRLYKVENDKMELDDSVIETLSQLFDVKVEDIKSEEEWINAKNAAKLAGCSTTTIYAKFKNGEINRKKINGLYHYNKKEIKNMNINKRMQENGKSGYKSCKGETLIKENEYYSSSDIAKKLNVSFGYASSSLSKFKKDNEEKVISIKSDSGGYMNALLKEFYKDFIDFMPDKYNKFKEKKETNKDFSIEKQQELIDNHQKDMVLELRETVKSQSAKIRKLNNKVEELESYHDKAEFKFDFFSERITNLENKIDELESKEEKSIAPVNGKEVEEKGFFSRLFS